MSQQNLQGTAISPRYVRAALAEDADLDGPISACRYYFYKSETAMTLPMAIVVCNRVRAAKNSH